MTVGNNLVMTGADPGTRITSCRAFPDEVACGTLANALLVSSAGASSANDPAIELTVAERQVLQLRVEVFVPPGGADQVIRLYRNSREDVLFTGTAIANAVLDHTITLDALAGDRFLVAVAPQGSGATNVGLNLFATSTGATFPASCQLALSFASATGNTFEDLCGNTVFTHYLSSAVPSPPSLGDGPFPEQGPAADFLIGDFLERGRVGDTSPAVLDWSQDVTVQLWVQIRAFSLNHSAVVFSDLDLDFGNGMDIVVQQAGTASTVNLDVQTCISPSSSALSDAISMYPNPNQWQFIRAVRAGGHVQVCVNGAPAASISTVPCTKPSSYAPQLGQQATNGGPFLNGLIDDVRVITGALPCN